MKRAATIMIVSVMMGLGILVTMLTYPMILFAGAKEEVTAAKKLLDAKRFDEARAAFQQILRRYPKERHHQAGSAYFIGLSYVYQKKDDEALKFFNKVLDGYKDRWYYCVRAKAYIGMILARKKDYEGAVEAFEDVVANYKQDKVWRADAQYKIGTAYLAMGKIDEAIEAFKKVQTECPSQVEKCLDAQTRIVDLLLRTKRYDEALRAAKIYFNFCPLSAEYMEKASSKVSRAFFAADGRLRRANAFLEFQQHGEAGKDGKKGTEDDLKNLLAEIKASPDPERKELFQIALDAQKEDTDGLRTRGYIYLLMDEPEGALSEFKAAYLSVPLKEDAIKRALDDIAIGLKVLNGTSIGAEVFLEYQKYGTIGPDGKPGTEDDLTDPLADY